MGINVEVLPEENLCIMNLQKRDCFVFLNPRLRTDDNVIDYYDETCDKKYIEVLPNDIFMVISSYTSDDGLTGSAEIMCLRTFEIIRMCINENNGGFNALRDSLVKIVKPIAPITANNIFEICKLTDLNKNDIFIILPIESTKPSVCVCIESKKRWIKQLTTSCKMVRYIDADLYIHEIPADASNINTVVMKFLNCPNISIPFKFD